MHKPNNRDPFATYGRKTKKQGNPVSKITKVAGKRAGGALRSEQRRQQKRSDSRR